MSFLHTSRERLIPHRRRLLAVAFAGFALCIPLIFTGASDIGFALIGPLAMAPYSLMCIAFSKPTRWIPDVLVAPATAMFLSFAAFTGVVWPVMVLFF